MATREGIGSDGLTEEQQYLAKEYRKNRLTRRKFIAQGIKAGLVGAISVGYSRFPTLAFAQGAQYANHPAIIAMKSWKGTPPDPTSPITITSWAEAGERWELPQRAVYPIWQFAHPNVKIDIVATPIGEIFPKIQLAMASKSDRYGIIDLDYAFLPQLISAGHVTNLQPYLDKDPAYRDDLYADVPENVLDLWRDKPLKQGGTLHAVPPDSNCQMFVYRKDVFDKLGIKTLPETWPETVNVAKELTGGSQYGFTGTLRRGYYSCHVFNTIFWSYGGEWFANGYKKPPTLNTEQAQIALDIMKKLLPYAAPGTLNAVDDEANALITTGTVVMAPSLWGGSVWTSPKTNPKYYDKIGVDIVPKGTGPKGDRRPIMGGLALFIPTYAHNKEWAFEWIKFAASKEVGKEWVEGLGQPARNSVLKKYSNIQPYFLALAKSLPHAHRMEPIPETGELYEVVGTALADVFTGSKTISQGLTSAQSAAEDVMRKAGYYKS
jgi:ABC-type glycerol-3-phosphate transport system substrate-binding protein